MLLYSEGGVGGKGTHACLPFWLKPRVDFHQKWLERLHQHFCPTRPSRGVFWGGRSRVNRPSTPMGVLGRFGFPRPFPPRRRAYTFRRRRGALTARWVCSEIPLPPSPALDGLSLLVPLGRGLGVLRLRGHTPQDPRGGRGPHFSEWDPWRPFFPAGVVVVRRLWASPFPLGGLPTQSPVNPWTSVTAPNLVPCTVA